MANYYADQFWASLRTRGLRRTLSYALMRLRSDDSAPVPIAERWWLNRSGFKPSSYFVYRFDSQPFGMRSEYLSDRDNDAIGRKNRRFGALLRNKLLFHRVMATNGDLRSPDLVGFIDRHRVLDARPPYSPIRFDQLFVEDDELIFKPVTGSRSSGVLRLHRDEATLDMLLNYPSDHGFIAVRVVRQAGYAAAVNPGSANSVRVVAMRDPDTNQVFIPAAVHRFGVESSGAVDNWNAGGVSCSIHLTHGKLGTGYRHPRETRWRAVPVARHPETDAKIEGTKIPKWDELISTIHAAMDFFPDLIYAAWDVLPTDEGWCILEGNEIMAIGLLQIHAGLLRDPRVSRFIAYHANGRKS